MEITSSFFLIYIYFLHYTFSNWNLIFVLDLVQVHDKFFDEPLLDNLYAACNYTEGKVYHIPT